MATTRYECSICFDSFKNTRTTCHHSLCSKCHVVVKLRNGRFDCPICMTSVELPKCGVSSFEEPITTDIHSIGTVCGVCGPKSMACISYLDCEKELYQSRDQHPEDENMGFCKDCKILICLVCKEVSHDNHTTTTVADHANEVKKTRQKKIAKSFENLSRIKEKGEEFDKNINDAEQAEIKTVQDQHSQLKNLLEKKVAELITEIKVYYQDHREQNAVFKREIDEEFNTFSNASEKVKSLEQLKDIEIIKNGPGIDQLISDARSKTYKTPDISGMNKLFLPGEIKTCELNSMIGTIAIPKVEKHEELGETRSPHIKNLDEEEKTNQTGKTLQSPVHNALEGQDKKPSHEKGKLQKGNKEKQGTSKKTEEGLEYHHEKLNKSSHIMNLDEEEKLNQTGETVQSHVNDLQGQVKKPSAEKRMLQKGLKKIGATKFTYKNPNLTNISDFNRPQKLVESFVYLFDQQWAEAHANLRTMEHKEMKHSVELLLRILKKTYVKCLSLATQETDLQNAMTSSAGLSDEDSGDLMEMDASTRKDIVHSVEQDIKEKFKEVHTELGEDTLSKLSLYIVGCVRVCWYMCIQNPPMHLDFGEKEGSNNHDNTWDKSKFKPVMRDGDRIDYVVWPAVYRHKGGKLMRKGHAEAV